MEAILKLARENPTIHSVVSVITSGNEASARIHEKFGFRFCGKSGGCEVFRLDAQKP